LSNVADFLVEHGIIAPDDRANSSGNYETHCIDKCVGEGKAADRTKFYVHELTGKFICFRCGYQGGFGALRKRFEPPTERERVLEAAQIIFKKHVAEAFDELSVRGFDNDTLQRYGIGYAPQGYGDLLRHQGFADEILVSTGLVKRHKNEEEQTEYLRDVLEGRITIPYYSADGDLYNWRGRLRHTEEKTSKRPKYLGLAGVPFRGPWNERGLYCESPECFVTEGELDSLTLLQHGLNAVALPGANILNPAWFENVIPTFVYDNDEAGRKASRKAVHEVPECKLVTLPEGEDVNSLIVSTGIDTFIAFVNKAKHYVEGHEEESDNLHFRLEKFEDWCYLNGERTGASTGFPLLDKAVDGLSSGLYVLGAGSNIGKSSFLMQTGIGAIKNNDDTVVAILSLDDDERTTFAKLLALEARITYAQAKKPKWELRHPTDPSRQLPELMERRKRAIERLKLYRDRFIIRDVKWGRTLPIFERFVKKLRRGNPAKRIILVCDSFDKMILDATQLSNVESKAALIQELKRVTTQYDICILTSAEIRKIGHARPNLDDIKDSIQVVYEADVVMLGYQDMHFDPETPLHFRSSETQAKHPIFELFIGKNKKGPGKGRLLYYFRQDQSAFKEVPEDEAVPYLEVIHEQTEPKRKKNQ